MSNASDKGRRQLSLFEVLKNKTTKPPLLANDSEVGDDQVKPQSSEDPHPSTTVVNQVRRINHIYDSHID